MQIRFNASDSYKHIFSVSAADVGQEHRIFTAARPKYIRTLGPTRSVREWREWLDTQKIDYPILERLA
jgi:hypothetical protein